MSLDPAHEIQAAEPAPVEGKFVRVIMADSEPIFRVGMRKLFALEDDLRVVAQAETAEQAIVAIQKFPADVMLYEARLSSQPSEAIREALRFNPSLKIVLIVTEATEHETVEYLRLGVRGIVTRIIAPDLLIKCLRKVCEGETWLDNRGVNWVIQAYRAQAEQLMNPRTQPKLTVKELWIISGVSQGLRNKDIAQEIGTTEQVVKNYLRKIYDKLGISDRLELALYCMHHRLLEGFEKPAEPESAEVSEADEPSSPVSD